MTEHDVHHGDDDHPHSHVHDEMVAHEPGGEDVEGHRVHAHDGVLHGHAPHRHDKRTSFLARLFGAAG